MNKAQLLASWDDKPFSSALRRAFGRVPRERFTRDEDRARAYEDTALPFAYGQTLSQPSTVLWMLHWLELAPEHRVLEIGTGTGYNAALLSHLVDQLVSIEIVPELTAQARELFQDLRLRNVTLVTGDGADGYEPAAPYDAIIATCGCPEILERWKAQLTDNGRLLVPVHHPEGGQEMLRYQAGNTESLGRFQFVPLTGKSG